MHKVYQAIRAVQQTLPPIRSKWVAIASYTALFVLAAVILPGLGEHIDLFVQQHGGLAFAFAGGLYGYGKWAYATERWRAEQERYGAQ